MGWRAIKYRCPVHGIFDELYWRGGEKEETPPDTLRCAGIEQGWDPCEEVSPRTYEVTAPMIQGAGKGEITAGYFCQGDGKVYASKSAAAKEMGKTGGYFPTPNERKQRARKTEQRIALSAQRKGVTVGERHDHIQKAGRNMRAKMKKR